MMNLSSLWHTLAIKGAMQVQKGNRVQNIWIYPAQNSAKEKSKISMNN